MSTNLYAQISEKVFISQIIEMARFLGWRVAHFRPGMTKRGRWVTAVSGDGVGFFDLVMIRGPRTIFAELKSEKGKLSHEQNKWIVTAKECPGVEVYVWRPSDIKNIERTLI